MRVKNSFLNVSSNFIIIFLKIILAFVVRTVFINKLGEEYLGIDGLFINILNMISLTELGIGTAINYLLYKPLANKDYKKVSTIMSFFKRTYFIIGLIVSAIGIIIMFFIPSIVGNISIDVNLYLIFALYLINTVFIYFISYKDTLILADQKNYKLTGIYVSINILTSIFQIVVLFLYRSFILYLVVQLVLNFIQRIIINKYIGKLYTEVDFYSKEKMTKSEKKEIKKNVGAMFLHKAGFYIVNSTDNIIISTFLNVSLVGIYTNYLSLVNMVTTALNTLFMSITSSFGNLVVAEGKSTQKNTFNVLNFTASILYGYVTIGFALFINNFICLWIGEGYLLSTEIVLLMCLNFYLLGMISPIDIVRQASGKYTKDKYVSILQAISNLIISIVLVKQIGLIGVVIGTTISTFFFPVLVKPYVIYKYVFESDFKEYYLNYFINLILLVLTYLGLNYLFSNILINVSWLNFFIRLILYTIIYMALYLVLNIRNNNFKFYKELIKNRRKKHE
ncbi:MAG: oligosaccharide flippase family protein [Bacilli bacterium]|nr:oligosaccharide flippase family protein [Bacilli bacterium]